MSGFQYTTPLRDFLDNVNEKLAQPIATGSMNQMCQTLGVNDINFVQDIRYLGADMMEAIGMPRVLVTNVVAILEYHEKQQQGNNSDKKQPLETPASMSSGGKLHSVHQQLLQISPSDAQDEKVCEMIIYHMSVLAIDPDQASQEDIKGYLAQVKATIDAEQKRSSFNTNHSTNNHNNSGFGPPDVSNKCVSCQQQAKGEMLKCGHRFCTPCLNKYMLTEITATPSRALGMSCPKQDCKHELTQQTIRHHLLRNEFQLYEQKTFEAFMANQANHTFPCPNEKCKDIISVDIKSADYDKPTGRIIEQDDHGKVLSESSYKHFRQFRIRCRTCQSNFCASCKTLPYHKGYTCEEFEEYGASRQCRFCRESLKPATTITNAPSPSLADVCTEEECVAKMKICCTKVKACGCACNGVRGERRCLPCLKCELDCEEDYCGICYCEALKDAPCVQLDSCNHIYHYDCVTTKIEKGYSGARIHFSYLTCPTDKIQMKHMEIHTVMSEHLRRHETISDMALARLKYENRLNAKELTDPSSEYYKKPRKFAEKLYLFFQCFKCKNPYFAGGYQCDDNSSEFDPKDLICGGCQPRTKGVKECKVHGKEWVTFKCKYCCEISNYFCWGNVHFCNNCHVPGTWQQLVTKLSGVNKKKIWEYPQCKSLTTKVNQVRRKKGISDKRRMELFSELRCDPKSCPLKKKHPPNGFEWGLGCSMCADKENDEINIQAQMKADREQKEAKKNGGRNKQNPWNTAKGKNITSKGKTILTAVPRHTGDKNGIIYYIGTHGKTTPWINPMLQGGELIRVTASPMSPNSEPVHCAIGREAVRCVTSNEQNSWFIIDFRDWLVSPTHYTLRHYSTWDTEGLRTWRLSGSSDGKQHNWVTLMEHRNDTSLDAKGKAHTWAIPQSAGFYRFFCIIQTGKNANDNYFLPLSGAEFYGRFYHQPRR